MESNKEIVLVAWHDARFFSGTYSEKTILEHKMCLFRSVGYLITRNDVTTVLAGEHNDEGEYRDITLIPSGSVIAVQKLSPITLPMAEKP